MEEQKPKTKEVAYIRQSRVYALALLNWLLVSFITLCAYDMPNNQEYLKSIWWRFAIAQLFLTVGLNPDKVLPAEEEKSEGKEES